MRARGARQRHWLVLCTLLSAPRQSLHVVALLNSILVCAVTCDQSSPCECFVSSRRWEVKAREDKIIFDRSTRCTRDAIRRLTPPKGCSGCRSEAHRKAAGRMWWLVCGKVAQVESGSWAVTNGQDAPSYSASCACTQSCLSSLAQGIHLQPQHHCRLPPSLLAHIRSVAYNQLYTSYSTEGHVHTKRRQTTYRNPATCRRLLHHHPLRRRLCQAALVVCL